MEPIHVSAILNAVILVVLEVLRRQTAKAASEAQRAATLAEAHAKQVDALKREIKTLNRRLKDGK